jgi:hypothetical protein
MNKKVKTESFRGLSITALITGILIYTIGLVITNYQEFYIDITQIAGYSGTLSTQFITSVFISIVIGLGLPIAAIVCGSIDLSRIQADILSSKGRGFDITGIVLGSIYLVLIVLEAFNLVQITFDDLITITFG